MNHAEKVDYITNSIDANEDWSGIKLFFEVKPRHDGIKEIKYIIFSKIFGQFIHQQGLIVDSMLIDQAENSLDEGKPFLNLAGCGDCIGVTFYILFRIKRF